MIKLATILKISLSLFYLTSVTLLVVTPFLSDNFARLFLPVFTLLFIFYAKPVSYYTTRLVGFILSYRSIDVKEAACFSLLIFLAYLLVTHADLILLLPITMTVPTAASYACLHRHFEKHIEKLWREMERGRSINERELKVRDVTWYLDIALVIATIVEIGYAIHLIHISSAVQNVTQPMLPPVGPSNQ